MEGRRGRENGLALKPGRRYSLEVHLEWRQYTKVEESRRAVVYSL